MARKKKDTVEVKKKVNTDGIMGLVGSTTEQAISDHILNQSLEHIIARKIETIVELWIWGNGC